MWHKLEKKINYKESKGVHRSKETQISLCPFLIIIIPILIIPFSFLLKYFSQLTSSLSNSAFLRRDVSLCFGEKNDNEPPPPARQGYLCYYFCPALPSFCPLFLPILSPFSLSPLNEGQTLLLLLLLLFHVEIPAEMPKQLPGLIAQSDNSWQLPIGSKVQNGMAKMPHCAGV